MDWLRRNWPDMLIGIALLAVIAGIVATLLTGGSFFPLGPGQGSTSVATPTTSSSNAGAPSVVAPVSPGSASPNAASPSTSNQAAESPQPQVGVVTPGGAAADDAQVAAPDTPSQPNAAAADDETAPAGGSPGAIAVLPPANSAAAAANADSGDADAPAADASPAGQPSAPAAASDAPTAPFRVSVGAFGSQTNAERQAQVFRDAGFPVFLGRQGDLVLVLVGPYDTEQEAQEAVTRIRSGGFGIEPVVYRFQPDGAETASVAVQADAAANAAGAEDAPASAEPSAAQTAAPSDAASSAASSDLQVSASGGMYLQVGAYATRDSAQPQIDRLQDMGFEVAERVESGLVKLLVGPYDGGDLSSAQERLTAEGVEHFARQ